MSVSCFNIPDKCKYFLQSESLLLLSINLCESNERDIIYNCSNDFVRAIRIFFMPPDTDVACEENTHNVKLSIECRYTTCRQNSSYGCDEQKCVLYSRYVE